LNACGIPTFTQPDAAAHAFCLMAQYSSNLRGLYETPVLVTDSPKETNPEQVQNVLKEAREAGRTLLTEIEAKAILCSYGIPAVETRPANDEGEAVELILRKRVDPNFGPIIFFGAGGGLVAASLDRAIGLPPLNATLAKRLMERTRTYAALKGGSQPRADLAALENLLTRFSQLVTEQPLIKEIDIDPLLASPGGAIALGVRVILFGPHLPAASLSKLVIRPYPTQYVHGWKLPDGTAVTIRPIRPEDESLMVDFHKSLSEETLHLRYFGLLKGEALITHERLARICFSDYDREIALVTETIQTERQIIAVARLIKARGANEAELAIVISDDWQGKGLGTKLLGDLLTIGRREAVERIVGHILPENYVMHRVCRKLGFELRYDTSRDVFRAEIELRPGECVRG
jgi:acetyltransferase